MAALKMDWLGLLAAFVRRNPKTSAMIAFNVGVSVAAVARRRKLAAAATIHVPGRLIELVPSARDDAAPRPARKAAKPAPRTRRKATG